MAQLRSTKQQPDEAKDELLEELKLNWIKHEKSRKRRIEIDNEKKIVTISNPFSKLASECVVLDVPDLSGCVELRFKIKILKHCSKSISFGFTADSGKYLRNIKDPMPEDELKSRNSWIFRCPSAIDADNTITFRIDFADNGNIHCVCDPQNTNISTNFKSPLPQRVKYGLIAQLKAGDSIQLVSCTVKRKLTAYEQSLIAKQFRAYMGGFFREWCFLCRENVNFGWFNQKILTSRNMLFCG